MGEIPFTVMLAMTLLMEEMGLIGYMAVAGEIPFTVMAVTTFLMEDPGKIP